MKSIYKITMATAMVFAFLLGPVQHYDLRAENINLVIDKAKLLRLKQPASMIIIGNPSIADATVRNGTLMILMGKSYGNTNLIALDSAGEEIANISLIVSPPEQQALVVYKGINNTSYICNPRCARVLSIGDEITTFNAVKEQIGNKNAMAAGGSAGSAPPPQ